MPKADWVIHDVAGRITTLRPDMTIEESVDLLRQAAPVGVIWLPKCNGVLNMRNTIRIRFEPYEESDVNEG